MTRFFSLLVSFAFLTFVLGCTGNGKPNTPVGTDSGSEDKKAPAGDVAAQEKELADLEKQIAAKEKELADLNKKADALRDKIAAAKGSGSGGVTPLFDLLAKLPKDRWPKDKDDSLKWAEAVEWAKKNAIGKRVSWSCLSRSEEIKFSSGSDGKYDAVLTGRVPSVDLYGAKWDWRIISGPYFGLNDGKFLLDVTGLSKQSAEKLRQTPKDNALTLTFKIDSVHGPGLLGVQYPAIVVTEISIKEIGHTAPAPSSSK